MHYLRITVLALLIVAVPLSAVNAKKKSSDLKKIIAVGYVDTGYMGFENLKPEQLSEMFRVELQKELNKKGYNAVLADMGPPVKKQVTAESVPEFKETNRQPTMAEMQQMIAQMNQVMNQMQGYRRPQHKPVAAQVLFHFRVRTGQSSLDTAETVGWAELFSNRSLDVADVESDTTKIHILVTQHNPENGQLIDRHATKASSTRFNRLAGTRYYTLEQSANHQQAFDRVFRSSVQKAAKWIDKQMKDETWEGQVFKKQGQKVYLNAGAAAGVTPGMRFQVVERQAVGGRGVDLGSEEISQGEIEVGDVQEKFATAQIVSGTARVGSILKPISQ